LRDAERPSLVRVTREGRPKQKGARDDYRARPESFASAALDRCGIYRAGGDQFAGCRTLGQGFGGDLPLSLSPAVGTNCATWIPSPPCGVARSPTCPICVSGTFAGTLTATSTVAPTIPMTPTARSSASRPWRFSLAIEPSTDLEIAAETAGFKLTETQ